MVLFPALDLPEMDNALVVNVNADEPVAGEVDRFPAESPELTRKK